MSGDAIPTIRRLELELASGECRKNPARLKQMLATDFIEFGKSGRIFDRDGVIALLQQAEYHPITLSGFDFSALSEDAVLVRYRSVCEGTRANRSSVWVRREGDWRLLHHQATLHQVRS